jgi:glutamate N-acetyltransferase/amino-acid N-acetyltransferase
VFEDERPTEFDPRVVATAMRGDTVTIEVELGAGAASATGWGCDLSAEYVSINADYHT